MDWMVRTGLAAFVALAGTDRGFPQQASTPQATLAEAFRSEPQWLTSPRLLKLGEKIDFEFYLPPRLAAGSLDIFPQYLERAEPGSGFRAGGALEWIERLNRECLRLTFIEGRATASYTPKKPGSYLARWRVGHETFYRYFATIEDDWCVLRFSTFEGLESEPTLHATGIPLDYRLPVERFRSEDPLLRKFLGYHRHYGDTIIPAFPDTPRLSLGERVKLYGEGLDRVRRLVPDPSCTRSARVEMHHDLDPGYTETFMRLGVNDHCGLNEANAKPWLGMPEFPYFSSPIDCRKIHQGESGSVIAHQWDFCGGWHFLGPVSWHYKAAAGDWTRAEPCLRQGIEELVNLAHLSGHPAFAVPLYDGLVGPGYPNPAFTYAVAEPRRFRGEVDDVFVVARALGPTEISRLMQDGAASLHHAVLAWTLDEPKDDMVKDTSGRGCDGRLVGHAERTHGRRAGGIRLDGEDGCVVADRAVPICGDFTLGLWVKPASSQQSYANLLSSHNDDVGRNHRGISLEQDGDRTNRFYLIAGDGSRWLGTSTATQLEADAWQHFAVVRRGGKLTHYRNGAVSAEGDLPDLPLRQATDPWRVGDWARGQGTDASDMLGFIEKYQRLIAFDFPKRHRMVFARSIDMADYYRRHFRVTPRTVFVSRTDHVGYDKWWLCHWCADGILVPRERIPWETRISSVHRLRQSVQSSKDPLSYEYVLVEDQRRQMRFERECSNPIWWFDYTKPQREPGGSAVSWVRTPDVEILRSDWTRSGDAQSVRLRMRTQASFPDYAICLWGLPTPFPSDRSRIKTNAKDFIAVKNTAGESHLVLVFDLKPDAELTVSVR